MQEIYQEIYNRGLNAKLLSRMKAIRPDISRNTVHLALNDENPSTPLRQRIQQEAKAILAEVKKEENQPIKTYPTPIPGSVLIEGKIGLYCEHELLAG